MQGSTCHVAKFGGTSVCNAAQFKKIKEIAAGFGNEVCIIPSAPGKRFFDDIKVTDLLIQLGNAIKNGSDFASLRTEILNRYHGIAKELNIEFDASQMLDEGISLAQTCEDALISRGEYICAKLLAKYLDYEFIDAADVIFFDEYGVVMMKKTLRAVAKRLEAVEHAVIPGFYGKELISGNIKTFSRGGSDVTGAIVARALNANIYENWTDVSGFYLTDPRIVKDAEKVDEIDFNELRELSCMGASVLHGSTVLPLIGSNIKIRVCNTNEPQAKGTIICPAVSKKSKLAGIAGKRGYTIVAIKKLALGDDSSFARRALHAFEACSVPVEHMPLSMDNLSVVTFTKSLEGKREMLKKELEAVLGDVYVEFGDGFSLVAAVSSMIGQSADAICIMFNALAKNNIRIRLIDNGSGSNSVVAGVDDLRFEDAIRAIYSEFKQNGYID